MLIPYNEMFGMKDDNIIEPLIDWNIQKNTISYDDFLDILRLFISELHGIETAITNALLEKNLEQSLKLLHSLKGSCKCCGLNHLASVVDDIHKQIKNGNEFDASLISKLTSSCRLTEAEIAKYIQ